MESLFYFLGRVKWNLFYPKSEMSVFIPVLGWVGGGWNLENGMCSFWKNVMHSCERPLIPQGYRVVTICPAIYGKHINIWNCCECCGNGNRSRALTAPLQHNVSINIIHFDNTELLVWSIFTDTLSFFIYFLRKCLSESFVPVWLWLKIIAKCNRKNTWLF